MVHGMHPWHFQKTNCYVYEELMKQWFICVWIGIYGYQNFVNESLLLKVLAACLNDA